METKKLLLAVLFIVMVGDGYGQVPNCIWAKGAANGSTPSIATDPSGSIYMTGGFNSPSITFDSITLNYTGANSGSFFIAKYDQSGNILWAKTAIGLATGTSLCCDSKGNVYVAGDFDNAKVIFGSDTLVNADAGGSDIFIIKYDTNGNIVWAKRAGGIYSELCVGITIDNHDNLYITGTFSGNGCAFGNIILTNAGATDIFIAKYDTLANVLWAKSAGGTDYDNCNGINADLYGNIYITGGFNSSSIIFGIDTLINPSGFIAKYDSIGNVVWAKSVGLNTFNYVSGVSIASDMVGNSYILGNFSTDSIILGNDTLLNNGGNDVFVAKYNVTGNVLWAKKAGGIYSDVGQCIKTDASNDVYITGEFSSPSIIFGTISLTNNGISATGDIYITKYNSSNGNVIWALDIGGGNSDGGTSLNIDKNGSSNVCGYVGSPVINFDSVPLNISGNGGIFLAKLSSTVGISEPATKTNSLLIYPNPTRNKLTLAFNASAKSQNTTLHLCDLTGRIILEKNFSAVTGENKMEMDVSGVAKGIYFLNAVGHSEIEEIESEVMKVVIE